MLIDDFSNPLLISHLGTNWRGVTDGVMGGVSEATISHLKSDNCLRMSGNVRLENNGGFIQVALNLVSGGNAFDASKFTGIRLSARGNGEQYSIHLRTLDNKRPWQSYRAQFVAGEDVQTLDIPFADFLPHRTDAPLDLTKLRRIGLVAIGRAFHADLIACRISFY